MLIILFIFRRLVLVLVLLLLINSQVVELDFSNE